IIPIAVCQSSPKTLEPANHESFKKKEGNYINPVSSSGCNVEMKQDPTKNDELNKT
ncbi:30062_t:CDS:2, partial [Gigaspora margarita]